MIKCFFSSGAMDLIGLVIGAVVNIAVLFFVAGAMHVPNNTVGKALIVALASLALGYIAGPFVFASLFVSLGFFFMALLMNLFVSLFLIKIIYRIGFSKAFSIWILSALVSVVVFVFLPVQAM